jgi:hypothetical protein
MGDYEISGFDTMGLAAEDELAESPRIGRPE